MDGYFSAKIDDMVRGSERGQPRLSGFLSPAEQYEAGIYLKRSHREIPHIFWGGYDGAERRRLITLPSHLADLSLGDAFCKNANNNWCNTQKHSISCVENHAGNASLFEEWVNPLRIDGGGYTVLNHRDYLGAILSLGIDRAAMGDIIPTGTSGAVIFFTPAIAGYLISSPSPLESVGRDKVKVTRFTLPLGFDSGRRYEEINKVIPSARLDAVTAALAGLSREKAKAEITKGSVSLNFKAVMGHDLPVSKGDMISVRGIGRFEIKALSERTRKDRLRLSALKYI